MKYLFYVSVAFCIFSGTALSLSAQPLHFIEDIEIINEPHTGSTEVLPKVKYTVSANKPLMVAKATTTRSKASLLTEQCKKMHFKFAMLLNREVETISNTKLFDFIDEWWGIRYRYGGTTKKGIDCSAFTGLLMSTVFAFKLPRTARMQYAAACEKVKKDALQEGDLVFFNTTGGISHVGFYLGNGYFVHASSSKGITINNLDENYFSRRFLGGGRYETVEEHSIAEATVVQNN